MKTLEAAYKADFRGWRGIIFLALAPALAYGVPAALLGGTGIGIGEANMPVLPSGIALTILLVMGWRGMPGLALGAWAAAIGCFLSGTGSSNMGGVAWLLLVPAGVCTQAAISYALARRVSPNLFDTTSAWELGRFLFASGPLGSAAGVLIACVATGYARDLRLVSLLMSGAAWWVLDIFACLAIVGFALGFLSRSHRPFTALAMVSAAAGILLGAAVVLGWLTHDVVLIQMRPELAPMQFNTALSFFFCGAGLLLLIHGRPRLARAVAVLPCTVGLLTLVEYVLGIDLRIDQLFLTHYITVNTTFPGRMPPSSAICLLLFGLALTQSGRATPGSHVTASTLYSTVASAGFVTLLSYLAGLGDVFAWAHVMPMAFHSSVGFVVLGLGGLAREVVQVEGAARRVSLSPIPTGVALAAISIGIWQAVYHNEEERIRGLARERATDITRLIDREIVYHSNTMARMANRWAFSGAYSKEEWTHMAQLVLNDFPSIAALAWADAESDVRWLEPLAGNEQVIGFRLSSHPEGQKVLKLVGETGRQESTGVINIKPIGKGFIVFTPISVQGKSDGYIIGVYRIDKLFQVLSPSAMDSFVYRVYEGDKIVYVSDAAKTWPDDPVAAVQIDREMRGGQWKLELIPQPEWLARQRSNVPALILFAGLFLSAATTIALLLLEAVRAQYDIIHMSEDRLRQLVDCAPTGLISVDEAGTIVDVNPEAQRQFGYTAEELLSRSIEMLMPLHLREIYRDERRAFNQQRVSRPIGNGQNLTALKKDGREFPVEVALAPFQTRQGPRILALVTDITERDEARRKLEAYTRALELINKDLDDFAYVASHDLRAPLTAIASLVLWLEEDTTGTLSDGSAKHLALVKNRVARMGKLLEDLLDYSRAGRTASHIEEVDADELVAQVTELVRHTSPLAVTRTGLPVFQTVRTPLQQVFRNLISNAIKHHDREACAIEIAAVESGPFYVFRVTDDGPGIPAQFRDRVFNMFQTLRPRDEIEGSGMGLALVRKLVERYGGVVYVVESSGRGTTIEFTWPKIITGD